MAKNDKGPFSENSPSPRLQDVCQLGIVGIYAKTSKWHIMILLLWLKILEWFWKTQLREFVHIFCHPPLNYCTYSNLELYLLGYETQTCPKSMPSVYSVVCHQSDYQQVEIFRIKPSFDSEIHYYENTLVFRKVLYIHT